MFIDCIKFIVELLMFSVVSVASSVIIFITLRVIITLFFAFFYVAEESEGEE